MYQRSHNHAKIWKKRYGACQNRPQKRNKIFTSFCPHTPVTDSTRHSDRVESAEPRVFVSVAASNLVRRLHHDLEGLVVPEKDILLRRTRRASGVDGRETHLNIALVAKDLALVWTLGSSPRLLFRVALGRSRVCVPTDAIGIIGTPSPEWDCEDRSQDRDVDRDDSDDCLTDSPFVDLLGCRRAAESENSADDGSGHDEDT